MLLGNSTLYLSAARVVSLPWGVGRIEAVLAHARLSSPAKSQRTSARRGMVMSCCTLLATAELPCAQRGTGTNVYGRVQDLYRVT